jgi:hypothetical protein
MGVPVNNSFGIRQIEQVEMLIERERELESCREFIILFIL